MATIAKTKNGPSARRKVGISAIAGMLIGLGITAAAAPAVYFAFQENFSQFTEFAALDVQNLNAARDGDRLVVTATIKNVGSTSISSIILEELSVDDLRLQQDPSLDDGSPKGNEYGELTFVGNKFDGDSCSASAIPMDATDKVYKISAGTAGTPPCKATGGSSPTATKAATVKIEGLTTIDNTGTQVISPVRIDGDGSVVLRIEIEGKGGSAATDVDFFDLTKSVDLTEELSIQLRFLSGESEEVTEVYRTSVKRG